MNIYESSKIWSIDRLLFDKTQEDYSELCFSNKLNINSNDLLLDYNEWDRKNDVDFSSINNDIIGDFVLIKPKLNEMESSIPKRNYFDISKDYSLRNARNICYQNKLVMSNDNFESLTLKERMRIKKERAKSLLLKKRHNLDTTKVGEIQSNVEFSLNFQKNFGNKSDNSTSIKKYRNRLSAQISRDKTKFELFRLSTENSILLEEKKNLMLENDLKNNEIKSLQRKIETMRVNCNCFSNNFDYISSNKIGSFSKIGLISTITILACIFVLNSWGSIHEDNDLNLQTDDTYSPRKLFSAEKSSVQSNESSYKKFINYTHSTNNSIDINNHISNELVLENNVDELLYTKRNQFIENFIGKISLSSDLNQKFLANKKKEKHCFNSNKINYQAKVIDTNYNKKLPISYADYIDLQKRESNNKKHAINDEISSFFCNPMYLTNSNLFNLFNETYDSQKLDEQNEMQNCFYIHMIIPDMEHNKFSNKKAYYEIGCKVFELNRLYN